MIENMMYMEEVLHNIQYELWDLEALDPSEFVNKLLACPLPGWQDKIVSMIRQAIYEYQNERTILKYIYIVDKLIKVPGPFQNAVTNSVVDLYCDVFYFLYIQKCNKQLDQIKILRKFWVGSVHAYYLSQMKQTLLAKINIDIDIFKAQTMAKIKAHYANKLGMSQEEINRQFPPVRTSEDKDTKFNNQKYVLQNKTNFTNIYASSNSHNYQNPSYQPYNYPYQAAGSNYDPISPLNDPRLNEEMKRKRLASQETRAAGGLMPQTYESKPKKIQHKEEIVVDFKYMLSKLKELNSYDCRECGIKFNSGDSLDNHKNDHLKEKLMTIDGCVTAKQWELSSEEGWVGESQVNMNFDNFVIGEEGWGCESAVCVFCCCELRMQFVDDQWVFVNATIVSIEGQRSIMHKNCQWILQSSTKTAP